MKILTAILIGLVLVGCASGGNQVVSNEQIVDSQESLVDEFHTNFIMVDKKLTEIGGFLSAAYGNGKYIIGAIKVECGIRMTARIGLRSILVVY